MNLFVTPDDVIEKTIGAVKVKLRPITAKEFMLKISMFRKIGNAFTEGAPLQPKELDELLNFLSDKIIEIEGVKEKITPELLGNMKVEPLMDLIRAVTEEISLSKQEQSFPQSNS